MSEVSPNHERKKLSLFTKVSLGVLTLIGVGFQTNSEVHSPDAPAATLMNPLSWPATPIADIITKIDGKTYGLTPNSNNLTNNQKQAEFYQAAENSQEAKK
jgi:hypothetical protein